VFTSVVERREKEENEGELFTTTIIADAIVSFFISKFEKMNKNDTGFLNPYAVSLPDRISLVLASFKHEYRDKIIHTNQTDSDIQAVKKIIKKSEIEGDISGEEVIMLAKLRRFIINNKISTSNKLAEYVS
jgi:glutaredoxin 2